MLRANTSYVLILAVATVYGSGTLAQQTIALTDDLSRADIVFAAATPAREYSGWQAAKWGADFFVSWSRATDRVVLNGYRLDKISSDQLKSLLQKDFAPNDLSVAIINEPTFGPFAILGRDKGYFAAPILTTSAALKNSSTVVHDLNDPKFKNHILPGAVALSAMKGAGIDVGALTSFSEIFTKTVPESTFIATKEPISGIVADKYFIVAKTAWTSSDSQSSWGMKIAPEKMKVEPDSK